ENSLQWCRKRCPPPSLLNSENRNAAYDEIFRIQRRSLPLSEWRTSGCVAAAGVVKWKEDRLSVSSKRDFLNILFKKV
ncbi:hypothetical protein, partial [Paenibacillus lautus]